MHFVPYIRRVDLLTPNAANEKQLNNNNNNNNYVQYLTESRHIGRYGFSNHRWRYIPAEYNPVTGVVIVSCSRYSSSDCGLERQEGGRTSISAALYNIYYIAGKNTRYSSYNMTWYYIYVMMVYRLLLLLYDSSLPSICCLKK